MELFQMALIKMDHNCVSAVSIVTKQQQPPTKSKPAVTLFSARCLCVTHKFMITLLRTVSCLQEFLFFYCRDPAYADILCMHISM